MRQSRSGWVKPGRKWLTLPPVLTIGAAKPNCFTELMIRALTESERFGHLVYVVTLSGKAALGVIQLIIAAAIAVGITDRIPPIAMRFAQVELAKDPHDFVATKIMTFLHVLPQADMRFYIIYFAAHGLLHVSVAYALLKEYDWAFPVGIGVLSLFVVYQMIEWAMGGGVILLFLSAVDLLVIFLTVQEWKYRSRGLV